MTNDAMIQLRMPKEVKQEVAELASSKGMSTSTFVRTVVLKELRNEKRRKQA